MDALSKLLPNPDLFLYSYVRQEAVLSSQIEGTQSTLTDLLRFENDEAAAGHSRDVIEVSNYVRALDMGMAAVKGNARINLDLIRTLHKTLLTHSKAADNAAGQFRTEQTWVDGARPDVAEYIPPSQSELPVAMRQLEEFIADGPMRTPPLLKAALVHAQFETIHPFKDGNGRTGRILIPLILCSEGILSEPLLYLSLYFKRHRDTYTAQLQRTRTRGDWESWIEFFAKGVRETADSAIEKTRRIERLFSEDEERIHAARIPRESGLRIMQVFRQRCITSAANAAKLADVSLPTANSTLARLEDADILHEITGKRSRRLYAYKGYINLLNEDTL